MKTEISIILSLLQIVFCGFTTQEASIIEVVGSKLFNSSSGEQFFIKGVAYQRMRKEGEIYDGEAEPGYIDSLASPSKCLRDLEYLKELGVNTVRVYQIDPRQSHDVCMDALANHGIYVLADLSEPDLSINRCAPSWDTSLFERYKAVVDSMQKHTNLLGFVAGNEVVNSADTSNAGAFVKASVRDIKRYIREKGYRKIPVGYASTDDMITRIPGAEFLTCGSEDLSVDFYGVNMFEWCGFSSYEVSGYRQRTQEFSTLPVPVFFSEFGCNTEHPRPFTEIDLLYGPSMAPVWSGGIAYELFQHENNYGLLEEKEHGKVVKLSDFNIVKLRFLEATPVGVQKDDLSMLPLPECPPVSAEWKLLPILPPTPDDGKCECLQATLLCVITPYFGVDEHELVQDVCKEIDCLEIEADASSGKYGNYSDCTIRQRASFALNKYWDENHRKPELCDFDRRAILVDSAKDVLQISASDGRACKVALGLEEEIESEPEEKESEPVKMAAKSAAQKPGQLGVLMLLVILSFIYLTT